MQKKIEGEQRGCREREEKRRKRERRKKIKRKRGKNVEDIKSPIERLGEIHILGNRSGAQKR